MTTRTNVLEEILEGKNKEKPKSIGFDYKVLNKKQRNKFCAYAPKDYGIVRKPQYDQKHVAAAGNVDLTVNNAMLEHSKELQSSKTKKKHSP